MIGRDSGCFGKKIYTSWWSAARASKNLNKFVNTAKTNPYRCERCHLYHVGNSLHTTGTKKHNRHARRNEYNERI